MVVETGEEKVEAMARVANMGVVKAVEDLEAADAAVEYAAESPETAGGWVRRTQD